MALNLRWLAQTCNRAEDALATLYGGIVFAMLIVAYQRVKGLKKYMRGVLGPLMAALLDDGKKQD